MDTEQIKKLIAWLENRVSLIDDNGKIIIKFAELTAEDFNSAGFGEEVIALTMKAEWWREMATDIEETPDFAEPEATSEQVLKYARDVVREYITKRLLS